MKINSRFYITRLKPKDLKAEKLKKYWASHRLLKPYQRVYLAFEISQSLLVISIISKFYHLKPL